MISEQVIDSPMAPRPPVHRLEDRIRVELTITLIRSARFVELKGLEPSTSALSLMSYNPMVRTSRPVSAPGSFFAN